MPALNRSTTAGLVTPVAVIAALAGGLAPVGATSTTSAPDRPPADVRVTVNADGNAGRVISERPACERRRSVAVVLRSGTESGVFGVYGSDADGRWAARMRRGTGGGSEEALAVALGDPRCRVARSAARAQSRAARPARVRVSLKGTVVRANHGRVTSRRPGCVRSVRVFLFDRPAGTLRWGYSTSTRTDDEGRYELGRGRRAARQAAVEYTTVVVGTASCAVAQSPILTVGG